MKLYYSFTCDGYARSFAPHRPAQAEEHVCLAPQNSDDGLPMQPGKQYSPKSSKERTWPPSSCQWNVSDLSSSRMMADRTSFADTADMVAYAHTINMPVRIPELQDLVE